MEKERNVKKKALENGDHCSLQCRTRIIASSYQGKINNFQPIIYHFVQKVSIMNAKVLCHF